MSNKIMKILISLKEVRNREREETSMRGAFGERCGKGVSAFDSFKEYLLLTPSNVF